MKIVFFKSIRWRIILLVLFPILLCALSIGLLTNTAVQAMDDMRTTVTQQALLYQKLSLPSVIVNSLEQYGRRKRRSHGKLP